jgi:hypothetical protein
VRRAEQRRRGQRIAQQPLQRRSGKAENSADCKSEQGAWQADFADDHLLDIAAAAKQRLEHGQRREADRTGPERNQQQGSDDAGKRRYRDGTTTRGGVKRSIEVVNAHPSSLGQYPAGRAQAHTMIEVWHKRPA